MKRIFYLHGFASGPSSNKARYFRDRLQAAGAQVEVPDLAGGDFEHLSISSQLKIIERAAGSATVSLIGSSMGGYLAGLYAARHPEGLDRMVLLAPAFGFARRWPERLGPELVAQWRTTGRMEVFHYAENRPVSLAYDLLEDGRRYEDYPDFRHPALIFHGASDDVVPASYSQEFAVAHPNVTLEILDSGHELLNVLDYMASKVERFLLHFSS